jgi:long-chain acyl-CoA synthetase
VECGIAAGDRVAILSQTRVAWVEADLGIVLAGAVTVPIYPTLLPDMVGEILRDSGARAVIVEDPVQLAKLFGPGTGPLPALQHVIVVEAVSRLDRPDEAGRLDVSVTDVVPPERGIPERGIPERGIPERGPTVQTLDEALARGHLRLEREPAELRERAGQVTHSSLAAIYYTSGTSGEPKGVELTHDNFVSEVEALAAQMPVGLEDEQLLFLPLAHIMAKLTVTLQLRVGYVTSFAASMEEAAEDCAHVKPTFIVGVPRVFEKIEESVLARARGSGGARARVFDWALGVGREVSALRRGGGQPRGLLSVEHRSAERLVFAQVKRELGGRVRFMLSGAAPLATTTAEFFHALGLLILEGYGLTESTGASTVNLPSRFRFGTVGLPLPGVQVRLDDDGEILLRGRSVTPGYWARPRDDAFTVEGWFRTGDVGRFDDAGFLMITDRKKDLIITAGGKNVAPQRVEQRLTQSPYVARAIVLGDRRKFLVALLVVDGEAIRAWARDNQLVGDLGALQRNTKVRALIASEIERVNASLASFESVKRFEILDRDLTIDRGEVTPTGKVKRRVIAERFSQLIERLYEGSTAEVEDLS